MPEETKSFVRGDETHTITTFRKFKGLMLDMLRGYPEYEYFGKFESTFPRTGKKVVEILIRHGVIEKIPIKEVKKHIEIMTPEELQKLPQGENRFLWYRLAPRGVDLAISMINLEHSEEIIKNSNQTLKSTQTIKTLTWVIVGASLLTLGSIMFKPFIQELIKSLF